MRTYCASLIAPGYFQELLTNFSSCAFRWNIEPPSQRLPKPPILIDKTPIMLISTSVAKIRIFYEWCVKICLVQLFTSSGALPNLADLNIILHFTFATLLNKHSDVRNEILCTSARDQEFIQGWGVWITTSLLQLEIIISGIGGLHSVHCNKVGVRFSTICIRYCEANSSIKEISRATWN